MVKVRILKTQKLQKKFQNYTDETLHKPIKFGGKKQDKKEY